MIPPLGKAARTILAILAITATCAHALVIRGYDPTRHDRFTGFPGAPAPNPNFMHAALNLSGVGWHTNNTARQLTMVSPLHFVGANHYRPGIGATIRFVASDGTIRDYTVASQTAITNDANVASDLFYGTLTAPIPAADNVAYHPFLNLTHVVRRGRNLVTELDEAAYQNKSLILLGKTARGASETLSTTTDISSASTNSTRVLRWNYTRASGSNDDAYLETGDSGSPVFINEGGVAAIVGSHSLVASSTDTVYNYSSFIPYYADKLDAAMASQGYHMTRAIPGSTTLTLAHTPSTAIIRAGHPFTVILTLNNTGTARADNVKLQNAFPAGTTVSSASGTDWFDESSASFTKARRAALEPAASGDYSITLNIPDPGTVQQQVTYSADQFSPTTENLDLNVIESFVSWRASLVDQTESGDDDLDHIGNLLEYAFGGDATTPSPFFPGTTTSLLPTLTKSGNTTSITYIRRTDYLNRALAYNLMTSTTLETDSWSSALPMITQTTVTAINPDFELVKVDLGTPTTQGFFQVHVTLNE